MAISIQFSTYQQLLCWSCQLACFACNTLLILTQRVSSVVILHVAVAPGVVTDPGKEEELLSGSHILEQTELDLGRWNKDCSHLQG